MEALEQYRRLLSGHDWYYQYSDDHRVWRKYQDRYQMIQTLQKQIDPDGGIWNQYAPDDYKKLLTIGGAPGVKPSLAEQIGLDLERRETDLSELSPDS